MVKFGKVSAYGEWGLSIEGREAMFSINDLSIL